MSRGQFLRLGAAGVAGAVGAGIAAGPAAAALPAATPQGDDVGYLSFGAVAELTSIAWYDRAARVRGLSPAERHRLTGARKAKRAHVDRMNAVLAPTGDSLLPGDFAANFPDGSFGSKARALALGMRIEQLLVSVYLTGAAFARDGGTRLLLGRLQSYDAQLLAWMHVLAGRPAATGLPDPLTVEQAGAALDRLVTTPSFPA